MMKTSDKKKDEELKSDIDEIQTQWSTSLSEDDFMSYTLMTLKFLTSHYDAVMTSDTFHNLMLLISEQLKLNPSDSPVH